jgi:hypothetical protein
MARRILLLAAALPAACSGVVRSAPASRPDALSYAQYQSLERGMTAKAIVRAFGPPADTLRRDGRVRGLKYWCENAAGEAVDLRLLFSAEERLEEWRLHVSDNADKKGG